MEAKLERPSHGHQDGTVTHSVVGLGGEDEGAKQKKWVLKKVKDKAKKMKDTIKNHHQQNDQLHAAPRYDYESSVVRETNLEKPKGDQQRATDEIEGYTPPQNKNGLPISSDTNNAKTESPPHTHCPNNTRANMVADTCNKPLSESASASEYAHKLYEKVSAAAGVNVMSKGSENGVKDYLSEKLKPGDEDKALSEVITDALHKRDDGEREDPPPPPPPRGKVTVSKEVAERLGLDTESKREGEDAVAAGEQSEGNTVSERLQNAFTSWLSKGTGTQTAQDSIANAFVNSSGSNGDGPKSDSRNEPHHR